MDWASRLKERVTLEQPVALDDGLGGKEISWGTVATVWAEVTAMGSSGRERASGQQPEAAAGYRVRMRYRPDVNAAMRVQWRNHILAIHSVHEYEERLELLTYEEGV